MPFPRTLTTRAIGPEQLLAVWDLTLQSDPEGPSLISRAAQLLPGCLHGLLSAPSWRTTDRDLPVLYVFVVLLHHRRQVVHFNVTDSPTAAWTAQQIVEAFPDDSAPRYLLRDRDRIYGGEFRRRVNGMRITEVLTA